MKTKPFKDIRRGSDKEYQEHLKRAREEVFSLKTDKDSDLFDDDSHDLLVSGNIDSIDLMGKICLLCGGINGEHHPSCNESF